MSRTSQEPVFGIWRSIGRISVALAAALALVSIVAPAAGAAFGFEPGSVDGEATRLNGSAAVSAGEHPHSLTNEFTLNTTPDPLLGIPLPDGNLHDLEVDLPAGFVANPRATPLCPLERVENPDLSEELGCPDSAQVGTINLIFPAGGSFEVPVYNVEPPSGLPAMLGFVIPFTGAVLLEPNLRAEGDYGLRVVVPRVSQGLSLITQELTTWGVPADPSHDQERGACLRSDPDENGNPKDDDVCPVQPPAKPFFTNGGNCSAGALQTDVQADSWQEPGIFHHAFFLTHEPPPDETLVGLSGCDLMPFDPGIDLAPTTALAESPSGLDVEVEMPNTGLLNPDGIAEAHLKKSVVNLPEGVTINPSSAEGLSSCTRADLARETVDSAPGLGCPNGSRLGSVDIETPLQEEHITGSLYLAQPDDPATSTPGAENPFDSLIALYVVAKNPERGLMIKLAGKVEADPRTGQITTTFDDLPQVPFSKFTLHFREGGRAPLVSPRTCGTYETVARFVPWSAADPDNPTTEEVVTTTSPFQVTRGVGGGPCPAGGLPAFKPGLTAGTINNAAGRFSPFNVRLTRNDGEQEFTRFSIKLPPGISAKLAGTPFCPDSTIEAAKTKTGAAELASPSCPAASEVGRTLVGAGVGSVLTYVPGKIYLAGPYNGSSLSIAAITAAKVGPFDVGTVVVRQALKIDPETAEVFIDSVGSDPIPHIIDGIPVHARDIRAYVDKPSFVLNPTSCDRTSTASTLLGAGLDFASDTDNNPITVTSPFQAADCAALPFKPKLSLRLIGGTKRGDHPRFRAHLKMNGIGEAAIERAQVTLPKSEFLENANIRTICTRVQFAKGTVPGEQCPAASVYGYAKATTPILDEPIEGPVFLRSSEHELPDLVAALHSGKINVNLVGRIDSVRGGGLRSTFESVPDAPVSEFTLTMQGGKKGLLVNSTNLCKGTHKAKVAFDGHNGKSSDSRIPLQAKCKGKGKAKRFSQRAVR